MSACWTPKLSVYIICTTLILSIDRFHVTSQLRSNVRTAMLDDKLLDLHTAVCCTWWARTWKEVFFVIIYNVVVRCANCEFHEHRIQRTGRFYLATQLSLFNSIESLF